MATKHYVGTIRATEETMYVSDPCYSPDAWCALGLEDVRPGAWRVFIETDAEDEAMAKRRHEPIETLAPAAIVAEYRRMPGDSDQVTSVGTEVVGEAGVDSGCMAILTPKTFNMISINDRVSNIALRELYLSSYQARVLPGGAVCETHDGDGAYPVSVTRDHEGMIVGIRVDFI